MATRMEAWRALLVEADIDLDIASAPATLAVLDELRAAIAAQRDLQTRIDGIARDAREHDASVAALAARMGIAAPGARKSDGAGKGVQVSVGHGGRRFNTKKK